MKNPRHLKNRSTCPQNDAMVVLRTAMVLSDAQAGRLRDLTDMFAEPGKAVERVPVEGMAPVLTLTRDEVRQGFRVRGRFAAEPNLPLTSADRVWLSSLLSALKDKGKVGMTADLVWLL